MEDDLASSHRPFLLSRSRDHRSGAKPWHRSSIILGELTVVLVEGHSVVAGGTVISEGDPEDCGAMCLVFLSLVLAMTPTVRVRHGHAAGIHLSPSLAPWHGSDRQKEVGGRPLDMVHVGTGKRGRQGAGVLRGFPPSLPGGPKYLSRSTVSTPNFPAVKKHPLDYPI